MKIQCPHCGEIVVVSGLGRRPLNVGVKIVCDALRTHGSVTAAAKVLGLSRGYVYRELSKHGTTPREVLATKQKVSIV